MKALGFTDNCTTCEKCGKTNLKGTYIVVDEYNNDSYLGSECVKKTTGATAPNKQLAKQNLKSFILTKAHLFAVNSLNYDSAHEIALKRLNKKYNN